MARGGEDSPGDVPPAPGPESMKTPFMEEDRPEPSFTDSPFPEGELPPETGEGRQFLDAPKRRMNAWLLAGIALLVLALAGGGVAAVLLISSGDASEESMRLECQENMREIEMAIRVYGERSPDETYPSSLEDLTDPGMRVMDAVPRCPSGDRPYTWVEGDIGRPPSVSCPNREDHNR